MTQETRQRGFVDYQPIARLVSQEASLDNSLPYRLSRILPAHDKLARIRVNNPSGTCMWRHFGWVGAALYRLN